jgi:UTP-glucose-1-phosphate uridylyltransferase
MELTLVVLAAGLGSRYGGLKQVDGVGPNGETLMDYAVFDAVRAGFTRLVFITRSDIDETVRARFSGLPGVAGVTAVNQALDDIPAPFTVPPDRAKPWGTAHAVLVTEKVIDGPFVVINADDFYGATSYRLLREHFERAPGAGVPECAMVGYTLRDTLSPFGHVTRGVCHVAEDGRVDRVTEVKQIIEQDGTITGVDEQGTAWTLTGDEPVSMNFWGFTPAVFPLLKAQFLDFLRHRGHDRKAECYISNTMDALILSGLVRLRSYRTEDRWFGMTSRGDRTEVERHIRNLVDAGVYPRKLW